MRAVVVRGVGEVAVEAVEDARIEAPTDALLRVTSSAICGTDLHIYEGRMGDVAIPWGELFRKDITIGMGLDHDTRYNAHLRDLIIAGRIKPSVVVSHRLPLADAPTFFHQFDQREDGYLKIILDPAASTTHRS